MSGVRYYLAAAPIPLNQQVPPGQRRRPRGVEVPRSLALAWLRRPGVGRYLGTRSGYEPGTRFWVGADGTTLRVRCVLEPWDDAPA